MGGVPAGGNTIKNVLLGIGTTVAAYAIVNVLFKKSSKEPNAIETRKQATVDAWKSVAQYMQYADDKFKTAACISCDVQEMKNEIIRELDKNSNSLSVLREDKDVDERMKTIIDRTRDMFADLKPMYNNFYDSLSLLMQLPAERQNEVLPDFQNRFMVRRNYIVETRDKESIALLLEDINKKYKLDLAPIRLDQTFKKDALINKWNIGCALVLDFQENGELLWIQDGQTTKGTWKMIEKELTIRMENGDLYVTQVRELGPTYFAFYSAADNLSLAGCPVENER